MRTPTSHDGAKNFQSLLEIMVRFEKFLTNQVRESWCTGVVGGWKWMGDWGKMLEVDGDHWGIGELDGDCVLLVVFLWIFLCT